jgi:hypothetical protein
MCQEILQFTAIITANLLLFGTQTARVQCTGTTQLNYILILINWQQMKKNKKSNG